jgi:hypothetical protein
MTEPADEAKQHLVDAAPDMLELLVYFYKHGYASFGDHERLIAVLTKATGKPPRE